ncbi:NUDIX hydrolase [Actinorhabdospora filicis]|uniref:NUDIX hydrolase n=1 Tax=Actinorhabdospora filicis TaxID=1785913 RepID=A0A9W6W278_9ACTN|nr:NUDIX domain-containing protein [Actinorhabdospora filicis]GLZ76717.1 NUDIX hydrolase [Actinorhabdospora filicis]
MDWTPALMYATVDIAAYTVDGELKVLLVRRGEPPYQGMWALPGGYVNNDETVGEAAHRELTEETGLALARPRLEHVADYTDPERDPRGRVLSFCHMALVPSPPPAVAGGDADDATWAPVGDILEGRLELAFDHRAMVIDSLERTRSLLEHTTIATAFCPAEFTVTELRRVYEAIWGHALDVRNFNRKVTGAEDFLVPTGGKTTRDGGRPAALYTLGTARRLQPPMYRPASISP